MRTFILLFLISLLFFQCEAPDIQQKDARTFYDLKTFLNQEKERLTASNIVLEKRIVLNGLMEEKLISSPDYDVEFSEFYTSDINRVAWQDKYEEVKTEQEIRYTSLDDKLDVKEFTVSKKEGNTIINIRKSTRNFLNHSDKELYYNPSEGYQIKSVRKSIGSSADTIEILVRFKN